MSDNDSFQYQLSVSLPPSEQFAKGDMVNIRADSAQEFMQNLTAFDVHLTQEAANVVANIRAQWTVIRDAGGQVIERAQNPHSAAQSPAQPTPPQDYQQQPQVPQEAPQAPQQGYQQQPTQPQDYQQQPQQPQQPTGPPPNVGPAPSCSHGVKQYLSRPYKNGKPGFWQAWACPADRGDQTQHPLEFIDQH